MAGGPILPSSVYLGGASGNLFPNFYIPATNTNTAGALEGVGVVASLAADAPAVLQFNMPETIPQRNVQTSYSINGECYLRRDEANHRRQECCGWSKSWNIDVD